MDDVTGPPARSRRGKAQSGVTCLGLLCQGQIRSPDRTVGRHFTQDDQARAELLRIKYRVNRLVRDVDLGRDVRGDRVCLCADLEVTALQDDEVSDEHLGVDVGAEFKTATGLYFQGVYPGRGVYVVNNSGTRINIYDVAGAGDAALGPGSAIGPVAIRYAVNCWFGAEVWNCLPIIANNGRT